MIRKKTITRAFTLAFSGLLIMVLMYILLLLFSQAGYLSKEVLLSSLKDREVHFALVLSLETSLLVAAVALFIGIPAGYALSRFNLPAGAVIDTLIDLPVVISPVALGALLLIFFNTTPGLFFQEHFFQVVFQVTGIIVAQATIVIFLAIRLMKSIFDSIDPAYEMAARVLGESRAGAFWRVTLPMARHGILAAFILSWARALGEFGATVTLAGATKMKTETLPIAIYLNLSAVKIEKAVALISIVVLLAFFILLSLRLLTDKGVWYR
ncbi:ABC transporter permease [Moorella sulfitireducens]|uniref:ABC transporter permease n=1 Tax=Neomoorella sulfitireducens TaxID=2972948 RepID=UPI0021AC7771